MSSNVYIFTHTHIHTYVLNFVTVCVFVCLEMKLCRQCKDKIVEKQNKANEDRGNATEMRIYVYESIFARPFINMHIHKYVMNGATKTYKQT